MVLSFPIRPILPDSSPEREHRGCRHGDSENGLRFCQEAPGTGPTGLGTKSSLESNNSLTAWVNSVPVSQMDTSLEDPSLATVYQGPGKGVVRMGCLQG